LVEHPEIAALIRKYKAPPEVVTAALRMALVPEGAGLIDNLAGGPPGFYVGNVYVLAGIPSVMRAMLGSLASKLTRGAVVESRSITAYISEPAIAEPLRRLQAEYANVDIGSYPFFKDGRIGVTLVARGVDTHLLAQVAERMKAMLLALGVTPTESLPVRGEIVTT